MTLHRAAQTQHLTALLRQRLSAPETWGGGRTAKICGGKWWAWQGLNLRPLRCQGRDTSAFSHETAYFRCSVARKKRERLRNQADLYRAVTA